MKDKRSISKLMPHCQHCLNAGQIRRFRLGKLNFIFTSESSMFSLARQRCVLIFGHWNCHFPKKPTLTNIIIVIIIVKLWSSFPLSYIRSGLHWLHLVCPPSSQETKGTKGFSLSHRPLFSLSVSLSHSKKMRRRRRVEYHTLAYVI